MCCWQGKHSCLAYRVSCELRTVSCRLGAFPGLLGDSDSDTCCSRRVSFSHISYSFRVTLRADLCLHYYRPKGYIYLERERERTKVFMLYLDLRDQTQTFLLKKKKNTSYRKECYFPNHQELQWAFFYSFENKRHQREIICTPIINAHPSHCMTEQCFSKPPHNFS